MGTSSGHACGNHSRSACCVEAFHPSHYPARDDAHCPWAGRTGVVREVTMKHYFLVRRSIWWVVPPLTMSLALGCGHRSPTQGEIDPYRFLSHGESADEKDLSSVTTVLLIAGQDEEREPDSPNLLDDSDLL